MVAGMPTLCDDDMVRMIGLDAMGLIGEKIYLYPEEKGRRGGRK
jgi:hypothetical protein